MRKLLRSILGRVSLWIDKTQGSLSANESCDVQLADFTGLTSLSVGRSRTIVNKAGRTLFKAQLAGQWVKVYEAHCEEHAEFIQAVSQSVDVGHLFPSVKKIHGPFVVAEWAEGRLDRHSNIEKHFTLLRKLHLTSITQLPPAAFDYWHDFLFPRFLRAAALMGKGSLAQEINCAVSKVWGRSSGFLSHPDLTRDNIVVNPQTAAIQIIDNEFLGVGYLPLLDFCNAVKALTPEEQAQAQDCWFGTGRDTSQSELLATAAAWLARLVGTAFISGRLAEALEYFDLYERDPLAILPFRFS